MYICILYVKPDMSKCIHAFPCKYEYLWTDMHECQYVSMYEGRHACMYVCMKPDMPECIHMFACVSVCI